MSVIHHLIFSSCCRNLVHSGLFAVVHQEGRTTKPVRWHLGPESTLCVSHTPQIPLHNIYVTRLGLTRSLARGGGVILRLHPSNLVAELRSPHVLRITLPPVCAHGSLLRTRPSGGHYPPGRHGYHQSRNGRGWTSPAGQAYQRQKGEPYYR